MCSTVTSNFTAFEHIFKTNLLTYFYDVKYDVTVYNFPTTMLLFTMNDVTIYDVKLFPPYWEVDGT